MFWSRRCLRLKHRSKIWRGPLLRELDVFKHSFSKDYSHCSISFLYGKELNLQAHTVMAAIKNTQRW